MTRRFATPISLGVMAAVFVIMFLLLSGAGFLIQLAAPTVLGGLAGIGTHVLLGRSPAEITDDQYTDDARGKMAASLNLVKQLEREARELKSFSMRDWIAKATKVTRELLRRIQQKAPSSLYSSASQTEAHLTSLLGVVNTYADIERNPAFYEDPDRMLVAGEDATRRFLEFQLEQIRLVNQGDMASYQANLATVAPPKMPTLGTKEQ